MGKLLSLFIIVLMASSCAGFIEHRSFIDEMDRETDSFFVAGQDFQTIPGDSGEAYRSRRDIMMRTPLSARSQKDMLQETSLMQELRKKEMNLGQREMQDYLEVSSSLEDLSEKIYYLNLPHSERSQYLSSKIAPKVYRRNGLLKRNNVGRGIASLGGNNYKNNARDVSLGMSKNQVRDVWGNPSRIEVAGNPIHENERWAFLDNGQVRYVFFESGNVQGWRID